MALQQALGERGLTFERFSIADFEFSAEFSRAIESVRIAEQAALRAEQELARVGFEAQAQVIQAENDALARIESANAQAQEITIQAEAQAAADIIMAQAQAQVLRLQAQELTDANLLAMWIESWDGILPHVMTDGAGIILQIPNPNNS